MSKRGGRKRPLLTKIGWFTKWRNEWKKDNPGVHMWNKLDVYIVKLYKDITWYIIVNKDTDMVEWQYSGGWARKVTMPKPNESLCFSKVYSHKLMNHLTVDSIDIIRGLLVSQHTQHIGFQMIINECIKQRRDSAITSDEQV